LFKVKSRGRHQLSCDFPWRTGILRLNASRYNSIFIALKWAHKLNVNLTNQWAHLKNSGRTYEPVGALSTLQDSCNLQFKAV